MCGNGDPKSSSSQPSFKSNLDPLSDMKMDNIKLQYAFLKRQMSELKKFKDASVTMDGFDLLLNRIPFNEMSSLHMLMNHKSPTPTFKRVVLHMLDANGNTVTSAPSEMMDNIFSEALLQMKAMGIAKDTKTHPMAHVGAVRKVVNIAKATLDMPPPQPSLKVGIVPNTQNGENITISGAIAFNNNGKAMCFTNRKTGDYICCKNGQCSTPEDH